MRFPCFGMLFMRKVLHIVICHWQIEDQGNSEYLKNSISFHPEVGMQYA
jgi:hypothetical protein